MSDTPKAPRAFASGVSMTLFGTMTLTVDLLPARRSDNAADPKLVCPACEEGVKLQQQYACPEHPEHGPFVSSEAHRAIEIDGMLRKVTDEELAALKQPTTPDKEAEFRVFRAADVERETLPGGSVYRARPKANAKVYHMLVDLVSDRSLAFIAELTLRGSQKLYRLVARDGLLTFVELIRPGEFHHIEVAGAEYDADVLTELSKFVKGGDGYAGVVEDFDGTVWRNTHRDRAAALAEAKRDPNSPTPEAVAVVVKKPEEDALVGIAAMLASAKGAKPAKAAAKKAPAKKAPAKKAPARRKT